MNVRVLNLSFGTDGVDNSYAWDALSYAAGVAWRKGIYVVAASGNAGKAAGGNISSGTITNPAFNPYVTAVGADDTAGTASLADDSLPSFSSVGNTRRSVDVLAPGRSLVSLGDPGSNIDLTYPGARVGTRFFKGSGTSQAAAVTSGAVALLVQKYPTATPDQLKKLLMSTGVKLPKVGAAAQGGGVLNLASTAPLPDKTSSAQTWFTGDGGLGFAGSRGTATLTDNGTELTGYIDIFGQWLSERLGRQRRPGVLVVQGDLERQRLDRRRVERQQLPHRDLVGHQLGWHPFSSITFSGGRWTGSRWTGGSWTGSRWTSSHWTADAWSSASWD